MAVPIATALQVGLMALDGAITLMTKAQLASAAAKRAQEAGLAHISDADWKQIQGSADDSINRLAEAIKNAPTS